MPTVDTGQPFQRFADEFVKPLSSLTQQNRKAKVLSKIDTKKMADDFTTPREANRINSHLLVIKRLFIEPNFTWADTLRA